MSDSEESSGSDFSAGSDNDDNEDTETLVCLRCQDVFSCNARGCDLEERICPVCVKKEMSDVIQQIIDDDKKDDSTPNVEETNALTIASAKTPADAETTAEEAMETAGEVVIPPAKQTDHARIRRVTAILEALLGDDVSVTIAMAGRDQTYVKKRFKTDKSTIVTLFIDLETIDSIPLLFDYLVLSGHVNSKLKRACFSRVVIRDSHGKKYVLLCILRTKCVNPRYDVLVLDVACTDPLLAVTRQLGLTNLFKFFTFLPDEPFDHGYALEQLKAYVHRANLVWTKEGPNKDACGRLMSDGFSPFIPVEVDVDAAVDVDGAAPLLGRRVSNRDTNTFAEEQAAGKLKSRGRRGTRGSATKKKKGLRTMKISGCPTPGLPPMPDIDLDFGGYENSEVCRMLCILWEDEFLTERLIAFIFCLAIALLINIFT
jgi:hypothetical protein